ncbi:uncharacterized protein [Nicotiana sylvestris]|uniref:uncharacterized protein n=1 Tax=Nicotiana sylvestris TaxID=4096 RepID=UPI00388C5201
MAGATETLPPTTFPRSSNETVFKVTDAKHYAPEPTFKVSDPYSYAPYFEPPGGTEKPSKIVEQDEISRKVKILEQSLRNMQGIGSQMSVSYKDLCLFPDVQLPVGFKMPKFDLHDGHRDPVAHLRGYCNKMRGAGGKDKLLMTYFSQSLSGATLEWYTRQDVSKWYTWDDMAQVFARHFKYNIEIIPNRMSLTKMENKPNESFREYELRWREQAARVNPPMEEKKDGRPQKQAIQNDIESLLGQKEHDDVAMVVSGSGHGSTGHSLWRAPAPHNALLPSQHFQAPNNPRKPEQGGEQRQRNSFTPIGESYTSLFEKLKHFGLIEPVLGYTSDPYAKGFDPTIRCMHHSNVQGHIIEDCRALKREIERLIQEGVIVIKDSDGEHANPLGNLLTEVNDIEVVNGLGNIDVEPGG